MKEKRKWILLPNLQVSNAYFVPELLASSEHIQPKPVVNL